MVYKPCDVIVNGMTYIQCHFVNGRINNRLRFGTPDTVIKLDGHRSLALFAPGKTLGYIRWRANEYGTQDWRFFILKTQATGLLTRVPGVSPAVITLASFTGTQPVKRALTALDSVEATAKNNLEAIPDSYWLTFQNAVLTRQKVRDLPRHYCKPEIKHAH